MFKNFGKEISFVPNSKVAKFVENLKEGKLTAIKCKRCGKVYFPPRAECICKGEVGWIELSGKGKLITFTTIYSAPSGFENIAPYTIGVIDLNEGGRLLAWVEGLKEEDLKIGMEMKVEIKKEGEKVWYVLKRG